MNRAPGGPESQHLTFHDRGLEYHPSGPFNGTNNVLKGKELEIYQEYERLYGPVAAHRYRLAKQKIEAMSLQNPYYMHPEGPQRGPQRGPIVLKTKPVPKKTTQGSQKVHRQTPIVLKTKPVKTKSTQGGKYRKNVYKKVGKKEILGKERVIYKKTGSKKEYVKSKDMFMPVAEYKKNKQK
jgi:hypothetical protein